MVPLQELSDAVRQAVRGYRGHVSLTGVVERRVCRLDFYATRPGNRDLRALERCASDGQRRLQRPVLMVVGSPVAIQETAKSWTQALAASDLLTGRQGGGDHDRFALFDDLQAECIVSAVTAFLDSHRELLDTLLPALSDQGAGDSLERHKTLATYPDHNCSIPRTAEAALGRPGQRLAWCGSWPQLPTRR